MNRIVIRSYALLISACAPFLTALPTWAEVSSPAGPPNLVSLHLEVSRGEEPVRGLTADDFQIRDRGKVAPIVAVQELDGEVAPRRLLLLFDHELSNAEQLVEAIDMAKLILAESVSAGDQVAIATYRSGFEPQLEMRPTLDRLAISRTLDSLRAEQVAQISNTPRAAGPTVSAEDLVTSRARNLESEKGMVQMEQGRILGLIRSLTKLERLAQSVPGSSRVVLFSSGFDSSMILGNLVTQRLDQSWSSAQSEAASRGELWNVSSVGRYGGGKVETAFFEMLDSYERLGSAIHAVQLGEADGARPADRGARGPNGLRIMAEKTGGTVFSDSRESLPLMSQILQPLGSTYLLTFESRSSRAAGRYRRLDVKLKNPVDGTVLISPPGYYERLSTE